MERIEKEFSGQLDIVVNNAGTSYPYKPTLDVTEEEYDMTMGVNCKSIFWSVNVCVPHILKSGRGGAFVNTASIGGSRPRPGLVWYAASKGTVVNVGVLLTQLNQPDHNANLLLGYQGTGSRVCSDGYTLQFSLTTYRSYWSLGKICRRTRHSGEPGQIYT